MIDGNVLAVAADPARDQHASRRGGGGRRSDGDADVDPRMDSVRLPPNGLSRIPKGEVIAMYSGSPHTMTSRMASRSRSVTFLRAGELE